MLTPTQMRIAARFCDARKFELKPDTSEDEVIAGSWVFDNGIFFMGAKGCDEVAALLRAKADELESQP